MEKKTTLILLLVAALLVFGAGCVGEERAPKITKYEGIYPGNMTKTVVTHLPDGDTSYYGRVMEIRDYDGTNDQVRFLDNYTVTCYWVDDFDWVPGEMHRMTILKDTSKITAVNISGY
jgi:hypothetical protein